MGIVASKPKATPSIRRHAAPGQIKIEYYEPPERMSEGGIVLVHQTTPSAKSPASQDNARYGVVLACGIYVAHRGDIHPEIAEFPLPNGTLVEFRPHNPYFDREKKPIIKTEDLLEWWYEGEFCKPLGITWHAPEWAK